MPDDNPWITFLKFIITCCKVINVLKIYIGSCIYLYIKNFIFTIFYHTIVSIICIEMYLNLYLLGNMTRVEDLFILLFIIEIYRFVCGFEVLNLLSNQNLLIYLFVFLFVKGFKFMTNKNE
jgi:hypothetical protein